MNKSESKYFNTAVLMDEALMALLEKKDFEYVTVKEICAKAGVNRSTFYLHYETVADLLNEATEYVNKRFTEMFPTTPEQFIPSIPEMELKDLVLIDSSYLTPYLTFVKENKALYKAYYRNSACLDARKIFENRCNSVFFPIMKRFRVPENELRFRIQFYINGIMAIIRQWLKENCAESVSEIEKIITDCIRPDFDIDVTQRGE